MWVAVVAAAVVTTADVINVTLTVDLIRFIGPSNNLDWMLPASPTQQPNHPFPNPVNFTTRAYNGTLPGPVIRVKPGDTLHITLINLLGPDGGDPPDGPNAFGLSNTTNLHLHGLHVSPEGAGDDVSRRVLPGTRFTYVYAIPTDHPIGTFWYHPHVHGSSSLQQGGGMAGALIVEPAVGPGHPTLPPALAAMEERVIVLQHLVFHTDGKYHDPNPYINHMNVYLYSADDQVDPDPVFAFGPPDSNGVVLANGAYRPVLPSVRPGEFTLFRLIAASLSAFLELAIVPHLANASGGPAPADLATNTVGNQRGNHAESADDSGCEVYVVAKDGIWVDTAYVNPRPLLVPGSRLDLAIRCPTAGTYDLISRPDAPYHPQFEDNTVVFSGVLATLPVTGNPVAMTPPSTLPARPAYMADLRAAPAPADTFDVVFFTPGGPMSFGPPFPAFDINRQSWSASAHDIVRNMTLGKLEEWQISIDGDETESSNHPFHLHVNPFQVVAIGGGDGGNPNTSALDIRVGEWRDTLPIPKDAPVTVRFRPDRFVGMALLHCHMIPHQDLGMAAVAVIVPAAASDAAPHPPRDVA
jgi:FtsP/CotA-like multicopper oxidase with cupredoxin domain